VVRVVLPNGFALFEEAGEAFFEIGGGPDACVFKYCALEVGVEARGRCRNKEALGAGNAGGAGGDEDFCAFIDSGHETVGGNDFVDQSEVFELGGFNKASSEEEIASAFFADLAGQKDGNDGGKETDSDFGVAEFGFGHGDSEIAKCGETATSGEGVAIDGGDHGFRVAPEAAKEFGEAAGVFLIVRGRLRGDGLEHGKVHAGAEARAGTGEDDDASVGLFDGVESGLKVRNHLRIDGITFVRPVQGDRRDVLGDVQDKRLIGH